MQDNELQDWLSLSESSLDPAWSNSLDAQYDRSGVVRYILPVISSNIAAVYYDSAEKDLYIQFQSGQWYRYMQVEPEKVIALLFSDDGSIGRAFNNHIKWEHAFEKLTGDDVVQLEFKVHSPMEKSN